MTPQILLSPPDVGELEQEYVLRAMRSGWVAPAGPDLEAFEREVAERCGVPCAVGLSSGTAALHLALLTWGIGKGDVVVTSTFTFAATVNAIVYTGAEPFFVDVDPATANMAPDLVEDALNRLQRAGTPAAAIIPVDMLGKCADYASLEAIAERYGARLLSDAAEALGASSDGRPSGSRGDAGVLSFNGNKVITTSGGGMLLAHDQAMANHVRYLSTQARQPVPHYEHTEVGYNYRLSNILAALGRAQMTRLDEMLDRRREWRNRYRELFRTWHGVNLIGGDDDCADNCWLTAIAVDPSVAGWSSQELGSALAEAGIESRPVWKPMHLQPSFRGAPGICTGVAERLFNQGLALPSGSVMKDEEFTWIESVLTSSLRFLNAR